MKLIDILVEELPKRGGWPDGKGVASNGPENTVIFHELGKPPFWFAGLTFTGKDTATKEEYEAALAAIKQGWDGEGMPPIGSKVSFLYNERYDYHKEIIPEHGQELEVVAHKTTTDGHDVAVCYWDKSGGGMAVCLVPGSLLPIRSEADKKRENLAKALHVASGAAPIEAVGIGPLYFEMADQIIAGKVPGIRIE